MPHLRFSFRLRTLFVLVTILSLALAIWSRYRQLRLLAANEHYAALQSGYSAVRLQKPDTNEWNSYWKQHWKWLSPLQMDRKAIEAALPLWQSSLRHAQLRDHYLAATRRPWLLLWLPNEAPPPRLPTDDRLLAEWWETQFGQHVRDNMLSEAWGTSANTSMLNRQCDILNGVDYSSDLHFNAFLRLREIMPVDDGPPESRPVHFSTFAGAPSSDTMESTQVP